MDRPIIYVGEIPLDTDFLFGAKSAYISIAKACAAVLGTGTLLNAFTCIPTSPASMQVLVTPGEMYSLQNCDPNAYGSLGTDSHPILKQGVVLGNTTLTLTAPGTGGNSWNYLIQIGFSETDGGSTVLPYYNSMNPAQPFAGPGNNGQPQNTQRLDSVNIQAKQGVQAPTGTQVTPSPDSGFAGAFVVTVANGQTTIISGNISTYNTANFINETLTQKISQATADLRYAQISSSQNNQYSYAVDTSVSANTVTATLSPAPSAYTAGMGIYVKIANTNTGASTINLNALGSKNITYTNTNALNANDLIGGQVALLIYDGTRFQLLDPANENNIALNIQNSTYVYAVDSGSANAYAVAPSPAVTSYVAGLYMAVKITNNNTTASTLNVSSLGTKNIKLITGSDPSSGDLLSGMIAIFQYDGTNFQLLNPGTGLAVAGTGLTKSGSTISVLKTLHSISTTTTLTSSDFSKTVVCTGSSAYAVTLPTVTSNAGKFIEFIIDTTSFALVTLTPASGTIDGQSTTIYGSNESAVLYCDGTNWITIAQKLQPVSFKAYATATIQIVLATTFYTVPFDTTVYDIGSFFNTGTHTYLPKYPGKYKFMWQNYTDTTLAAGDTLVGAINYGSGPTAEFRRFVWGGNAQPYVGIDRLVSLNGSSDSVTASAARDGSINQPTLQGGSGHSVFEAVRISNF